MYAQGAHAFQGPDPTIFVSSELCNHHKVEGEYHLDVETKGVSEETLVDPVQNSIHNKWVAVALLVGLVVSNHIACLLAITNLRLTLGHSVSIEQHII